MLIIANLSDLIFFVGSLIFIVVLSKPLVDGSLTAQESTRHVMSLAALLFSWTSFYLVTIRPFLRKPRLRLDVNIQRSDPTQSERHQDWQRSWFIRLCIKNNGQLTAKNCVGRLIEVRKADRTRIERFDPLYLYWSRQGEPDNFKPIDIQGNSDFYFLDVAQVKEKEQTLSLRVVIPKGQRLVTEQGFSEKPDFSPGTYFLNIAVYGEAVYIRPTWFKIAWSKDFSIDPPCSIKVERP